MTAKRASRLDQPATTSRGFDKELAELGALSEALRLHPAPETAQIEYLRKTLAHRNNFLVSKAARLVADHAIATLLPEVLAAYERFFDDAVKTDPQCWAKAALAKAMVKLEFQESAPYLLGMKHHQLEPVWGGSSDTAGALRGTCVHALVACPGLANSDLIDLLLEPLVDTDKTVRMEAARAIGYAGGASAWLVLKLRASLRKEEPEVLGAAFAALLELDMAKGIPLVAGFLDDPEETAAEAAFVLAATHAPEALAALVARRRRGADAWFGTALDNSIALTRLPQALEFLLRVIRQEERHADSALEAISRVFSSKEVKAQVAAAVAESGSTRLEKAFREFFAS
jgi:HEAT repeat protein